MDLTPGQMYRFQTRDNRVPQIGRFIRRVDDTYIFNVNDIETSYHTNTLLGMQPRANGIGFDDMFVHIGGKRYKRYKQSKRSKRYKRSKRSKRSKRYKQKSSRFNRD